MNIKGNKVVLRCIEPQDLEAIRQMTNDSEQERLIAGWSYPTSVKHQEDWYQRILQDRNNLRLAIELDQKFVGVLSLSNIDWKNRTADHGIRLTLDAPRQKGIATDAVRAIMRYAFEELNLNRLYTTILEYNEASLNLYAKCGWKREGLLKQSVYKNGQYHNQFIVAIIRPDYDSAKTLMGGVNM